MNTKKITLNQTAWAVSFSYASLFVLGMADNIRGALFPEILNYFSISSSMGAVSFAVASFTAFLGNFSAFKILNRYSLSQILLFAIFTMAAGCLIMGQSSQFSMYLVGSSLLGLSIGLMGISQNLLISETVSEERKNRALAGLHSMYGLASFIAPVLAARLAVYTGVWRAAFYAVSCLCLFYMICHVLIFKSDKPFLSQSQDVDFDSKNQIQIPLKSYLLMAGLFAPYVVAEILMGTRLAQYMRTYYNFDLVASSRYVTLFYLGLLFGRVVYSFVKVNVPIKIQLNVSLISSAVLIVAGMYIHPLFLAISGLTMAPFYPLCVSYITSLTGDQSRRFFTFSMAAQSLAVVTMHLVVGYMTDVVGLFYAFGVGTFALVCSLVCLNVHPKKLY